MRMVALADEMTASQLIILVAGYGQSLKFRIELMLIFVLVIVVIVVIVGLNPLTPTVVIWVQLCQTGLSRHYKNYK